MRLLFGGGELKCGGGRGGGGWMVVRGRGGRGIGGV